MELVEYYLQVIAISSIRLRLFRFLFFLFLVLRVFGGGVSLPQGLLGILKA